MRHTDLKKDDTAESVELAAHDETSETLSESDASVAVDELSVLQAQVDDYKAQAQNHWDKALRALSELDNVRKRAERDIANARKFGIEPLVRELLPVLDGLEQGLISGQNNTAEPATEGLVLTLKMLHQLLAKFSVQIIDPDQQPFDPGLHEAMSVQAASSVEAGTVLKVFQKGYRLHDRVLRPARVVVAGTVDA